MTDDHLNSHAIATLSVVIRRSIAALRVAVELLRETPSKILMDRVVDESITLSGSVAQLARVCDLSALAVPDQKSRPPVVDVEPIFDLFHRVRNWDAFGPCVNCGLTLPDA